MTSVLVTYIHETLARGMIGPRLYKVEGLDVLISVRHV
jgi:hypothetical protein